MPDRPLVSIGLPVYNGENFLREALDSLVAQTYREMEIIITDNASTDATEAISREFAARDPRVSYSRSDVNRGAAWNHNDAFHRSRGSYFKWAAHDDICAPELIEQCVDAMERDDGVVMAAGKAGGVIDGRIVRESYEFPMRLDSSRPSERFRDLIMVEHPCTLAFGLIRRSALERTPLIGSYVGSDRNLIAELALLGRLFETPDYQFFQRQHGLRSMVAFAEPRRRRVWFDPTRDKALHLPTWRTGWEYGRSVLRQPLPLRERAACMTALLEWDLHHRRELFRDLQGVPRDLAQAAGLVRPRTERWDSDLRAARSELTRLVPAGATVVLVDDNTWDVSDGLDGRRVLPFLERDGRYYGTPPDDAAAIDELERMRGVHGAHFIAFPWHASWWLDHFPAFGRHLRSTYPRIAGRRLVLFDLRIAPGQPPAPAATA